MKIKQVKTEETIIKLLKENNILVITRNGYDTEAHIVNQENEKIADIVYQVWPRLIGGKQMHKIYENKNIELRLTLEECGGYQRKLENQEQKREAQQRKAKAMEAMEYLKGFWEGDNITITADFVDYVETLAEYLQKKS